jgi:hypothetical protein
MRREIDGPHMLVVAGLSSKSIKPVGVRALKTGEKRQR